MEAYSLYLHIPFCRQRCAYCDFNTYAGLEGLIPAYLAALQHEIKIGAARAGASLPVHTVFLGGGTPSLLPAEGLDSVLETIAHCFDLQPGLEVSLEANPGTLSLEYLRVLRSAGVNRLSLGMQSAQPEELHLLERQHTFQEVIQAVQWARQAGFTNLNLDLIYGLPGQTLAQWQFSLELALGLQPEHLALYALTVEPGTPFGAWARRGWLENPDPDVAADQYEWSRLRLAEAGYIHYEISNWARHTPGDSLAATANPAFACRHNLQYWWNQPYLGFGAGAHGYAAGWRTANVLLPQEYIQRMQAKTPSTGVFPQTPATQSGERIDRQAEIAETMIMGLRLVREGIARPLFQERFGQEILEVFPQPIERFIRLGLLEWVGENLRLAPRAHLLGNQVFVEFI